jgi:HlyD family secretion protein
LFTIAQDLTKMQIEVSVDEADISRIKMGQSASFTVDSYPEQSFKGKVVQIRNAPIITQNVVTYITVVNVDNTDLKLKPGMTANVSIEVARKEDILKLPPAALRFKPKSKSEEPKQAKQNGAPAGSSAPQTSGKPGGRKGAGGQNVYILKDNTPTAVPVKTGIANNSSIELLESSIKEGDEVIIEQIGGDTKKKAASGSPMGRPF